MSLYNVWYTLANPNSCVPISKAILILWRISDTEMCDNPIGLFSRLTGEQ